MYDDIKNDLILLNPRNSFYINASGRLQCQNTSITYDLSYYDYNLFHEINVDLAMADILEDEQTPSKDNKPTNNCGTLWRPIDLRTDFFEFDANNGSLGSIYHAYIPRP